MKKAKLLFILALVFLALAIGINHFNVIDLGPLDAPQVNELGTPFPTLEPQLLESLYHAPLNNQ